MRRVLFLAVMVLFSLQAAAQKWVRVNTVGYLPSDVKVAVFISTQSADAETFNVCDAVTGEVVYTGQTKAVSGEKWKMASAYRLNFTPAMRLWIPLKTVNIGETCDR